MPTSKRTPNPGRPVPKRSGDPAFGDALARHAGHKVMRLLGYWALVQTFGGWEGVAAQPCYSEGSIQRWRLEFLDVFGCHAEDYLPGHDALFRETFYGHADNTWDSPEGRQVQSEALVVHEAQKAASKGRKRARPAPEAPAAESLHDALGTVKA